MEKYGAVFLVDPREEEGDSKGSAMYFAKYLFFFTYVLDNLFKISKLFSF